MFDTKEIQKVKKKINFPRFASAHPERTGLEGKTSNAQQRNTMTDTKSMWKKNFREHFQKKSFLFLFVYDGIIHSIAENTKLWLCAAVRLKQCLFILKKKLSLTFQTRSVTAKKVRNRSRK